MIKTVKVKKQLRLDELIKYVRDNHLYPETFKSNFNDFAHFDKTGKYQLIEQKALNQAVKFTVEVEEEITEDTEFEALVFILVSGRIEAINNYHNIRSARSLFESYETEKQIYALIDNNLELIWEAESE